MKLAYPEIQKVFDTEEQCINSVVIENQQLFLEFCSDLYMQTQGFEGKTVLSANDKPMEIAKNLELLNQFVPFEINRKNLITKLNSAAEKIAVSPEFYEATMSELSGVERYLFELINELSGNVECAKLSISAIIKAAGLQFEDNYDSLCEKVIDYMELVRAYDKSKLFVLVNFRSYAPDSECELFLDTVHRQQFDVIMLENTEHPLLKNETRYIIDKDLCEIT